MSAACKLFKELKDHFDAHCVDAKLEREEITLEIKAADLGFVALSLRNNPLFSFEMLIDICGIDYQTYGLGDWVTHSATHTGFDRGVVQNDAPQNQTDKPRFAAIYHLLSIKHNHRLRLKVFAMMTNSQDKVNYPVLESITHIWPSANWYEREAFDLYGIQFKNHPDQRRLLTDYNFEGHPFRKDFPLTGTVEVRYDAKKEEVIYEPVTSVTPRTIIPKVVRTSEKEQTFLKDAKE